jgi:transposase
MGKHYEVEFKQMIVELLESGQGTRQVSEEYGLNDSMIRRWRREHQSEKPSFTGKGNISLTPEQSEIRRLKKELKDAQIERDILKKAVSIFSKSDR